MELQIVYLPPDDLTPYKGNTRKHTAKDIEQIKESIKADGFNDPIGIWGDENLIVEGHGRQIAAIEMGLEKVPCIRLDHMTETQRRDYAIRHNRTAEFSEWDFGKLEEELAALAIEGIDLSGLEFEFDSAITDTTSVTDDDYEPAVPEEPKAKLGDIYQLGNHRLMCGNSINDDDIEKLMDGETAKMLFTSPPYSDMREYEGGKDLSVENLAQFIEAYRPYTDYQCVNLGIQRKDNDIVPYWDAYTRIAKKCGYKMLAWNVWDKLTCGSIGQQRAFFPIRHEFIFVYGTDFFEINQTVEKKEDSIRGEQIKSIRQKDGSMKPHYIHAAYNEFKQMESVLSLLSEHGEIRSLHPATFPVGLPAEYIKAMTQKGDAVIEPFGGSGTTLIACEELNRRCFIMELEPKYVDVIIDRWEKFTGMKAVLLNG